MSIGFTLAARNIWRHPRRTALTIAAIGFAAGVLIFFVGLQLSSYDAAINASVNVFHGHMQVQKQGYFEKPQLRNSIEKPDDVLRQVASLDAVTAVSSRALAFGLVSSEERTYGVQIVGVDPEREAGVSTIPSQIRQGAYLDAPTKDAPAVLGSVLARNLKVDIGSEITVLGQGVDGSLAATVLSVVGVFESGADDIDRNLIHIPLQTLQETFYLGNAAHVLAIRLNDLKRDRAVQKTLVEGFNREGYADLRVLRWDELMPGLKQMIDLDMSSGWIFYFSLILIVTFSVLNTFLMSVLERTKEFSIMLALGMKPGQISRLVMLESLFLTLGGLVFGYVLGIGAILYFGSVGFYIPGSEAIAKQWNMPTRLYTEISLGALRNGPGVILISAMLATLIPAARIFWLKPVDALREG